MKFLHFQNMFLLDQKLIDVSAVSSVLGKWKSIFFFLKFIKIDTKKNVNLRQFFTPNIKLVKKNFL